MICFIRNRPALQVGRHQVLDYGMEWLETALRRAAAGAEIDEFPFLDEVRDGIERYLETACSLQTLPIEDLFERLRGMLERIGCAPIASHLRMLAPPLTLPLPIIARSAGNAFELAFFESLRTELGMLVAAGAEEIELLGLEDAVREMRGGGPWNAGCQRFADEVRSYVESWRCSHLAAGSGREFVIGWT